MPKAKTGISAPTMTPGALSAASKPVKPTPGAGASPVARPKAFKKPKAATAGPVAAPSGSGTLNAGVAKPKMTKAGVGTKSVPSPTGPFSPPGTKKPRMAGQGML